MQKNTIKKIYELLRDKYGEQGWWPIFVNGKIEYHPGNYELPEKGKEFEIYVGAILTQNTAWKNVEKALINLYNSKLLNAEAILKENENEIAKLIKPAGYYNIKAKKLKKAAEFYLSLEGKMPEREELLRVWGIGRETADSILLYAYKKASFVVDAYTKRMLKNLSIIEGNEDYDEIKAVFERSLERDYRIYNEYHALIVEHGKRFYSKKEKWKEDFLLLKIR